MLLTKEQRKAVKSIYDRGPEWFGKDHPASYREFRRRAFPEFCGGAIMIKAGILFLGIETDGYIHS